MSRRYIDHPDDDADEEKPPTALEQRVLERMMKYMEEEVIKARAANAVRPDYPFTCDGCGRAHIIDTVIPSDLWNQISDGCGMLCAVCIDQRLVKHSLTCDCAEFYYYGKALKSRLYEGQKP